MTVIMRLVVPSNWDGQEFDGFIGLGRIEVNRTRWVAVGQMDSIVIPDGGTLVIRREGRLITVERP